MEGVKYWISNRHFNYINRYPEYKYQPQKRNGRITRKYVRRPQDKFTSRYEENNRIMEMFYQDPQRFFSSSSSPNNVQQEFASMIKSEQQHQQESDMSSADHFVSLPDPKINSPESYSSSSCSSSNMGSPLQTPPFSTASSTAENMLFEKNIFFFNNNNGSCLAHSEEFMMPTTTPASMMIHNTEQQQQLYYDNSIFPLYNFTQQLQQQQQQLIVNSPADSIDSDNKFLIDQFTCSHIESCSEWTLTHPTELPAAPLCAEQQQQIYNNVSNIDYYPIDSIDPSLLNIDDINNDSNSTQYGFYH